MSYVNDNGIHEGDLIVLRNCHNSSWNGCLGILLKRPPDTRWDRVCMFTVPAGYSGEKISLVPLGFIRPITE